MPGTGKTTEVTRLVDQIGARYGPHALLVSSFTKAAATELVQSLEKTAALRGDEDGDDRLSIARENVGTLHAICYRALKQPELATGKKIDDWNTYQPTYALGAGRTEDMDDAWVETKSASPGAVASAQYHRLRAKMVARELWPPTVTYFAKHWEDWKYQHDLLDFTDLIERASRDVSVAPGSPYFGLIDEAQDLSPLQFALVRQWGQHMEYVLFVGDDDQVLFAFTGASADVFLNPPVPDDHKRVLEQSYRVPPAVLDYSLKWISKVRKREAKVYQPRGLDDKYPFLTETGAIRRLPDDCTWKNPEVVWKDIEKTLTRIPDVMILATCSYMLEPMKAFLRTLGVPFHNPYRKERGDWNPLADGNGTRSKDRLLAFAKADAALYGSECLWTEADVYAWASVLNSKTGVLKTGAKTLLNDLKESERPVEYDRLCELFPKPVLETLGIDDWLGLVGFHADLTWYEQHLLAEKAKAMAYPLAVARKRGLTALLDQPPVCLGTVHSVKGATGSAVYLFPDISVAGMQEYLRIGDARDGVLRVMYVGMTRAREELVLCAPSSHLAVQWLPI